MINTKIKIVKLLLLVEMKVADIINYINCNVVTVNYINYISSNLYVREKILYRPILNK